MLSPNTRIGDRVLVEGELMSLKLGGDNGPEYYLVSVPGTSKPIMVIPERLRSWEKSNFMLTDLDFSGNRTVLARNIRSYRHRLNMSQSAFAKAMGVSQSAVALWESGKVAPQYLRMFEIASALGVSVYDLIGEMQP